MPAADAHPPAAGAADPGSDGAEEEILQRCVSSTALAFERELRLAWPQVQGSAAAGSFRLADAEVRLCIDLMQMPPRRLGRLEFPQLDVRYRFRGGSAGARRALLARLDRAMHKGGG